MRSPSRYSKWKVGTAFAACLVLILGACAPAARNGNEPLVAVLNAPSEAVIGGSAERLQEDILRDGPLGFKLVSSGAMRFQETHNDFFHSRAAGTAGRVARSYGADIAVMVGASVLRRDVTVSDDQQTRRVDVTVQMQAVLIDAATDAVLSTQYAALMHASRRESNRQPVIDIHQDPDVIVLRNQGVDDLARVVEANLRDHLGIDTTSPAGSG